MKISDLLETPFSPPGHGKTPKSTERRVCVAYRQADPYPGYWAAPVAYMGDFDHGELIKAMRRHRPGTDLSLFNEEIPDVPIPLTGVAVNTPPPVDTGSRQDITCDGSPEQQQQTWPTLIAAVATPPPEDPDSRQDILTGMPDQERHTPLLEDVAITPPPDDPGSQNIFSSGTPERPTRRASSQRLREDAWEFSKATPVAPGSDGLPRYKVQWDPVWVYKSSIRSLGRRAAVTFRKLQHNNAGPFLGGGDKGWTQMPKGYRFRYRWDATVIKLRRVNGFTQGLVQWPPSVVCWEDLTEGARQQLLTLV